MYATVETRSDSFADLRRDALAVRDAVAEAPLSSRIDAIGALLREADALTAAAVALLGRGGVEAVSGLPAEQCLRIFGNRTVGDSLTLTRVAESLQRLPITAGRFGDGDVSWSQVRGIVFALSHVRIKDWQVVDAFVGEQARLLADADGQELVDRVDRLCARLRADLTLTREDRGAKGNFLVLQPDLFGSGGDLWGHADEECFAAIAQAVDARADAPRHPDEEGPSRAEQQMHALVGICESWLAGGSNGLRPRPRLLATFDLAAMGDQSRDDAITLLRSIAGRAPRMSSVTRDALLCDATIVPVFFSGSQPVEVGDALNTFSGKVRGAIAARDQRCRFCLHSPVAWCDAHHVVPGSGRSVTDGILLCRRCHRRVHRYNWRIRFQQDGTVEFSRRGRTFISPPP